MTTVRVRGIYATALTRLLDADHTVVQASEPIRDRFDAGFPVAPADATVGTTDDRQGVAVSGDPDAVAAVADACRAVSRDAFAWRSPAPAGAVFEGVVADTLDGGAIVDLDRGPRAVDGFLPYASAEDYVEEGDVRRVQVTEPAAPWADARPELDADLRVERELLTLVRGGSIEAAGAARMEDLLPVDPPEGWAVRWTDASDDADLDALAAALSDAGEEAEALTEATADADPDEAPRLLAAPRATTHVWFGREGRFALDEERRAVTATMPGHHRIKAGSRHASAAVDFAEAVCDRALAADGERTDEGDGIAGGAFPFDVVTRQFGPTAGDRVAIAHGKPDGRLLTLGRGTVTDRDPDGSVTLRREMSAGGTYDALGVERRAGDVAVTKFTEGRWWYATVYRGADDEKRGTYVNVCTPVEVFPDAVRYVDLHVDVVKRPDGTVERVDDDELDEAVEAGDVSEPLAEKARAIASKLEDAL